MAELKTKRTTQSVGAFLKAIPDEGRRNDAIAVAAMMGEITKAKPAMWGTSIVGFGTYRYTYASGRAGDWPVTGFAPRKQHLTLYLTSGLDEALLAKLGKHTLTGGCLHIKSLADVHLPTLKTLIRRAAKKTAARGKESGSRV